MWLSAALVVLIVIVLISVSWPNLVGAPWVPTSMRVVHKMLKLADVGPNDIVYDLGCGDGRVIVTAARRYGARAVGIEIDPLRYLWCQVLITILGLRDRVRVEYGNLFSQDLSEATVVTCYLLQVTNKKLEGKLLDELKFGTRVVSNTFSFLQLHPVQRDGDARLYTLIQPQS
jgi:predicted RNA methylase